MTVDTLDGLGERLDRLAAHHSDSITIRPATGASARRPDGLRYVLVAASVIVVALTSWAIVRGGGDTATESPADRLDDAPEPDPSANDDATPNDDLDGDPAPAETATPDAAGLRVDVITATANEAGTDSLTLDLGGPAPFTAYSAAPTRDRLLDDAIGLFIQEPPSAIDMCDSSHSWGTSEPTGVVSITLPRGWFDVADGPMATRVDGGVAAKIIVCALAGGGPVEITVHGPATLDRDQISMAPTEDGMFIRLGPEPPFDAGSVDGFVELVETLAIYAEPELHERPDERFVVNRRSVDPTTLRVAHVTPDRSVLVWIASGTETWQSDLMVCVGLRLGDVTSAGCGPPEQALAGDIAIMYEEGDSSIGAYLATPALAAEAAALGLAVERDIVLVEAGSGISDPGRLGDLLEVLAAERSDG